MKLTIYIKESTIELHDELMESDIFLDVIDSNFNRCGYECVFEVEINNLERVWQLQNKFKRDIRVTFDHEGNYAIVI
ncbi:hypothetical protein CBE79_04520 [Priestia megaterium]|nr:hypothetical protein CBE78_02015 [Priestia megaterium]TPF22132.1 hypothetical protein CBE79_04520 [Priestia megaterium]